MRVINLGAHPTRSARSSPRSRCPASLASNNLNQLVKKVAPHEVYNLAAQSHVKVSFEMPEYTAQVDAVGTLRLLDALRETGVKARFYLQLQRRRGVT